MATTIDTVIDDRYRVVEKLPHFPAVATKLLRLLSREDVSVDEIGGLIRSDAALASGVLRIVNSPLYATATPVSSIHSAVCLMGFDRVRDFALTVAMRSFFTSGVRIDILRRLWRHSLACALICEELSANCLGARAGDDRAYTAGLLHNIGRLGLFVQHPLDYTTFIEDESCREVDVRDWEREYFGLDHCEAGRWLARKWGFPEVIQEAAGNHHDPPSRVSFELQDLVKIAVLFADGLGFDVLPPAHPFSAQDVIAMLPASTQFRNSPSPSAMTERINARLDSFD
jgi:HD-like signal output (HDOD) protein